MFRGLVAVALAALSVLTSALPQLAVASPLAPTDCQTGGFCFAGVRLADGLIPDLARGDFNGDGKPDLAGLTTTFPAKVAIMLGGGDGSFTGPTTYTLTTNFNTTQTMDVGDLNGDGRTDIAVAIFEAGSFSPAHPFNVFLAGADGTLGPALVLPKPPSTRSIAIGDVNGDSSPDLVTTSSSFPNKVYVFPGAGDGSFGPIQDGGSTNPATNIALRHMDGDGKLDLLLGGSIAYGKGDGTFEAPATVGPPSIIFTTGDFDNDGNADIASGTFANDPVTLEITGRAWVLLGQGNRTFALPQDYFLPFGTTVRAIDQGDWTGDGVADLALAGELGPTTVHILVGRGDGTFGMKQDLDFSNQPSALASADWNADGRLDLALGGFPSLSLMNLAFVPTPDREPSVAAPTMIAASHYDPVRFTVRVTDPDSDPIQSLTADLSGLPAGHKATFTVARQQYEGEFGWMPGPADAGSYPVEFHAANAISASATTVIHVAPPTGAPHGELFQSYFSDLGFPGRIDDLAAGDLNRDGHTDVVGVVRTTLAVVVLLGRGDATFHLSQTLPLTVIDRQTLLEDLNGDSRMDILVGSASEVAAYLGRGDGTFYAPTVTTTGASSNGEKQIALADLDRDLRPDLAVLSGSTGVIVLLANGDGTFRRDQAYPLGRGPRSMETADMDEDGVGDLLVVDFFGGISVLRARGDGTLDPPVVSPVDFPTSLSTGDANGDGHVDVAISQQGLDTVTLLLGAGDGTLRPGPAPVPATSTYNAVLTDLNGDGRGDLVAYGDFGLATFLTGAYGSLSPARQTPSLFGTRLHAAELNEDGRMDFLIPNTEGRVGILLGNGDGTFGSGSHFPGGGVVALGTFNADPNLDLVSSTSILPGLGDGTFGPGTGYDTPGYASDIVTGDVNGDQRLDLILTHFDVDAVDLHLGNGDGTFQPRRQIEAGPGPASAALADFNRDGKMDMAVANFPAFAGGVRILFGNGDGTFGAPVLVASIPNTQSVAAADLNGDGIQDFAATDGTGPSGTGSGNSVYVYHGLGDGSFAPGGQFLTAPASNFVTISDVNRDGHPDLLVGTRQGVSVLLGTDQGTFLQHQTFPMGRGQTVDIEPVDLDGDGVQDLAAIGRGDLYLSAMIGSGGGSFGRLRQFGVGLLANSLAVGDLNGDGRPDALVGHIGEKSYVTVHLNLGPASGPALHASVTIEPRTLNLKSQGGPMTVRIELPIGMNAYSIHPASVRIENSIVPLPKGASVGDHDGDGVEELSLKFDRAAFSALEPGDHVLSVTGTLEGEGPFEGKALLRVIRPGGGHGPLALRVHSPLGGGAVMIASMDAPGVTHSVRVFDVHGRLVRRWTSPAADDGLHTAWDGRSGGGSRCGSGVYFIRVDAERRHGVAKTVMVR